MKVVRGAEARAALTRSFQSGEPDPATLERNRSIYGEPLTPEEAVGWIIAEVRQGGDGAAQRWALKLDGLPAGGIEVPGEEIAHARREIDPGLLEAVRHAIRRLTRFHESQPAAGFLEHGPDGALGQLLRPVDRVGVYVPAGAAPLPSSLIHTAVPAKVAGVGEIVVCSPPGRDGRVSPVTLATAAELGIERVFALGGAVAVAAMAYGTETVPRVDKIGGPGNVYTVLAMRAVYGQVGIVSLPGPTETLVLADDTADPRLVAADLLAQAEHANAEPVLVTTSASLADAALSEIEHQLSALPEPNQAWARSSITERGVACIVDSVEEGIELANLYAPEHLCLLVQDPWQWLGKVRNAGGIFVGERSMEALGDYLAGPSHVMPTGGTARFSSPVNVRDFQKIISVVGLNERGLREAAADAARLARAEGLEAHARAIEARLPEGYGRIRLVPPDERYRESFLAGMRELQAEGRRTELDLAVVEADFPAFVRRELEKTDPARVPPGRVPESILWIVDGENWVGRVGLRHSLLPHLREVGGHIGYEVRPTRRKEGHGREALRLALQEARALGLTRVMVTCNATNAGSRRIIEANGGILEDEREVEEYGTVRRYWIDL